MLPPRRKADTDNSDQSSYNTYQSGGAISDPSAVPAAYTNDPESAAFGSGSTGGEGAYSNGSGGETDRANAWESRFGWRIDIMAAVAYLGGPASGQSRHGRVYLELMGSTGIPHPRDAERLRPVPW